PRAREALAEAASESWRPAARASFTLLCTLAALAVFSLKSMPNFYSRYRVALAPEGIRIEPTPKEWLELPRADIYFPIHLEQHRLQVIDFRALTRYLLASTRPDEPIFAFPALAMLYFVTGRDNPTHQDYFFGNNVTYEEQLEVIRTLDRVRVPKVVVVNYPNDYFTIKGKDFTRLIRSYLERNYYLEKRIGPYDVLQRYGASMGGLPPDDGL
ncbi:MAG: hypothetical protein Q8R92_06710, partial [Deltaproteobacteria bacterium]|nr:hypothetical protein [Deltaproteobacteria bacterium]